MYTLSYATKPKEDTKLRGNSSSWYPNSDCDLFFLSECVKCWKEYDVPGLDLEVDLNPKEIIYCGDNKGVSHGQYVVKDTKGNVLDTGKDILVWYKVNGTWLIDQDMHNSDMLSAKAQVIQLARALAETTEPGSCFTPDAVYMPEGHHLTKGREAINQWMLEHQQPYKMTYEPDMEFEQLGEDMASLKGVSVWRNTMRLPVCRWRYWMVFKRVEGKWLINYYTWTEVE